MHYVITCTGSQYEVDATHVQCQDGLVMFTNDPHHFGTPPSPVLCLPLVGIIMIEGR